MAIGLKIIENKLKKENITLTLNLVQVAALMSVIRTMRIAVADGESKENKKVIRQLDELDDVIIHAIMKSTGHPNDLQVWDFLKSPLKGEEE